MREPKARSAATGSSFRLVLIFAARPPADHPAFLVVAGVPVALRLAVGAVRAGASELVLLGPPDVCDRASALARADARVGSAAIFAGAAPPSALPIVSMGAELSVPAPLWMALARGGIPAARAAAPPDASVLPVRTAGEARAATRRVVRQLERPGASAFARVNGFVSRPITRLLVDTRVSPAQVTASHTAIGLVSACLFATGDPRALVAAGLLFDLASILDGVDGELARARLEDSPAGAWVDTVGDGIVYLAFAIGLPCGYARFAALRGLAWAAWAGPLGGALVASAAVLVFGMARYATSRRLGGSMSGLADGLLPGLGSAPRRLARALVALGRRACFARVVAVLGVLAGTIGGHVFYDALFFGTTAVVVALAAGFVLAARRAPARLHVAAAASTVCLDRARAGPPHAPRGKT